MCHFRTHIVNITNVCEGMEYGGNEKPRTTQWSIVATECNKTFNEGVMSTLYHKI